MSYSFKNVKAYTSRAISGTTEPYIPEIGEEYQPSLEYEIVGNPIGDYSVTFDLADKNHSYKSPRRRPVRKSSRTTSVSCLWNDKIPWEVNIDPYNTAGGADPTKSPIKPNIPDLGGGSPNAGVSPEPTLHVTFVKSAKGTLVPRPPTDSVEYFDAVRIKRSQQIGIVFKPGGQISRMALMMGQPASDSWQRMISSSCSAKMADVYSSSISALSVTANRFWPFFFWEVKNVPARETVFAQEFLVEVRNQRVDYNKLRQVTWRSSMRWIPSANTSMLAPSAPVASLPQADPRSPAATIQFDDVAGLTGLDPGIAVGTTYLLVWDNHSGVAVYEREGKLLGPKASNSSFPNPFSLGSLFSQVKASIDPTLNYPAGLQPGFSVANGKGITAYEDCRVMFDSYRKRFWIYAMATFRLNFSGGPWDPAMIVQYPTGKLVLRNKAAVAVSKTEDPRDGFYTYWWNETINNGDCNLPDGCGDPDFKVSGEGADYPSIGIAPKYFLATIGVNRRDAAFDTSMAAKAQAWLDCKSSFVSHAETINWCGPFYVHVAVVDADALASGGFPAGIPPGRSYGPFIDRDNYLSDRTEKGDFATISARGVKPVLMRGAQVQTQFPTTIQSADAYFVNNH